MDKNPYNILNGSKDTLPLSSTKTGTITSLGNTISGSGTDFGAEIKKGDFVVDLTQNEVRLIVDVSDTAEFAQIDRAFSTDITVAINLVIVDEDDAAMRELSILNSGASPGEVDGKVFAVNEVTTWNANDADARGQHGFIIPKVVDTTGTTFSYSILR